MSRTKSIIVILLNLCIAFGYYVGNQNANETHLSSDLHNIIPVCLKKDDPSLYAKDLFCNDIQNVAYYTPFYVETLRFFAKFTNGDYVQSLNILTFICHALFGILWFFLLFRITNNFWAALLVSVVMRGIIWIPGYEYWGISDLWPMLPRVVYYALMPLPFLLLSFTNNIKFFVAAFAIGFILNFHPITGLGGILLFLGFVSLQQYRHHQKVKKLFSLQNAGVSFCIFLGMLPFLFTYFSNVSTDATYDVSLYKEALAVKFSSYLSEPITFWKQWLQLKFIIHLVPVVLYIVFAKFKGNELQKKRAYFLCWLSILLFLLPNLTAVAEKIINSLFEVNIRMSFQLVRIQKLLIVAFFFALLFWIDLIMKKRSFKKMIPIATIAFLGLLVISKHDVFDRIPLVSNDMIRRVLPNALSIGNITNGNESDDLNEMLQFIRKNTPKDALFYAPDIGRSGGKRSVDLDSKGANMLIEGNPKRFVAWYQAYTGYNKRSQPESNQFLRDYGIEYVLIYIELPEFELMHQVGKWRLYKVQSD